MGKVKKMKKIVTKFLGVLIALIMILGTLPLQALAADDEVCLVINGGTQNERRLTVNDIKSNQSGDGWSWNVAKEDESAGLKLNNYNGGYIYATNKMLLFNLKLVGDNNTITVDGSEAGDSPAIGLSMEAMLNSITGSGSLNINIINGNDNSIGIFGNSNTLYCESDGNLNISVKDGSDNMCGYGINAGDVFFNKKQNANIYAGVGINAGRQDKSGGVTFLEKNNVNITSKKEGIVAHAENVSFAESSSGVCSVKSNTSCAVSLNNGSKLEVHGKSTPIKLESFGCEPVMGGEVSYSVNYKLSKNEVENINTYEFTYTEMQLIIGKQGYSSSDLNENINNVEQGWRWDASSQTLILDDFGKDNPTDNSIYAEFGLKIVLADGSENKIVCSGETLRTNGIKSIGNCEISGNGNLSIQVDENVKYGKGILATEDLTIKTAGNIRVYAPSTGLNASNIILNNSGLIDVKADDNGISGYGYITINGTGVINVKGNDYGIDAFDGLNISGSSPINIITEIVGIESGGDIAIYGSGNFSINSDNDGIYLWEDDTKVLIGDNRSVSITSVNPCISAKNKGAVLYIEGTGSPISLQTKYSGAPVIENKNSEGTLLGGSMLQNYYVDGDPNGEFLALLFKESPKIIEEDTDFSFVQGSDKPLVIKTSGTIETFVGIKIDGKEVPNKYYDVTSGSTIISIKPEFMNTLPAGNHKVEIVSKLGSTFMELTIKESNGQATPPATGDNNNILAWEMMLFVSASLAAASVVVKRKFSK